MFAICTDVLHPSCGMPHRIAGRVIWDVVWEQCGRPGWRGSLWLHIPNTFYSATAFGLWPDRYDLGLGLLLLKD